MWLPGPPSRSCSELVCRPIVVERDVTPMQTQSPLPAEASDCGLVVVGSGLMDDLDDEGKLVDEDLTACRAF